MSGTSQRSSSFTIGIILCLLGAIFFSTKAILVKLAYRETSVDAITLLALRMVFSLPFFVASAVFTSSRSGNTRFTIKQWFAVALVGATGYYASSLLDFLGLQYVSAATERLILFIYPTLVLVFSALLFKTRIAAVQWVAIALTYGGLVLAFAGEVAWDDAHPKFYYGAGLIFLCAITYALYIVGSGRLIPLVGAAKFNSYAMTFACVAVLAHFFITSDSQLLNLDPAIYYYGAAMALLSTVIPSYLVTFGIRRIGSDNSAIVGSVGPVSTILQAHIFLGEPVLAAQVAGTVLILTGVLLIGKKKQPAPHSLPEERD